MPRKFFCRNTDKSSIDGVRELSHVTWDDVVDKPEDLGGGSGLLVVTITYSAGTYTSDKTPAEMEAAVASGQIVVGIIKSSTYSIQVYYCGRANISENAVAYQFVRPAAKGNEYLICQREDSTSWEMY